MRNKQKHPETKTILKNFYNSESFFFVISNIQQKYFVNPEIAFQSQLKKCGQWE